MAAAHHSARAGTSAPAQWTETHATWARRSFSVRAGRGSKCSGGSAAPRRACTSTCALHRPGLAPASALGDVYVQRLNASGMQLTAETLDAASAGARPPLARGASYRPSEMKAI